jgi:hypothetical protein
LNPHRKQLAPARHQIIQRARILILERAYGRTNGASELGQDRGVDPIRLRQLPSGFGKVTRLTWIDDRDWQNHKLPARLPIGFPGHRKLLRL